MTLCEKCLHAEVCAIRDGHDEGDERALKYCSNFRGWISVDERLPDRQGYFLITDEAGGVMVALWMKQFGWLSNFSANKITHWMPLPEPPKMKGGAE